MAKVTLNKDGTPRKKGSGKTKGAGCYAKISWRELKRFVGTDVPIPVSRVWLRGLGAEVDKYVESPPGNVPADEGAEELVAEGGGGPTASEGSAERVEPLEAVRGEASDRVPEPEAEVEEGVREEDAEPEEEKKEWEAEESESLPEAGLEDAEDEEDAEASEREDEEKEGASESLFADNSLAATAYRYSQNFDL